MNPNDEMENILLRNSDYVFSTLFSTEPIANDFNKYEVNPFGFRSDDFVEKRDMLIAGCSYTFGIGVPVDGTWGHFVSKINGIPYHNLSGPGKSIPWIINNIFVYCKKYGNPKIIMCLFPNFTRMEISSYSNHMVSEKHNGIKFKKNKKEMLEYTVDLQTDFIDQPIFSKKPHTAENIIPLESSVYYAISHIKILETYCKSNNIKLVWSTWSYPEYAFFKKHKMGYSFATNELEHWHNDNGIEKYYINPVLANSNLDFFISCHEEYRKKYKNNFDIASDYYNNVGHYGVHRHIHIAESFIKYIDEYY